MIADLRGKLALVAESEPGLRREIREAFERSDATCLELDEADLARSLATVTARVGRVDSLIVGRNPQAKASGFESFTDENLIAATTGGAWRLFKLMHQIKDACGAYPRYAIGLSTPAPDHLAPSEDLRAAGDAAIETLCRYASYRLLDEDVRVNVIRYRPGCGESAPPRRPASLEDLAKAVVALCSGWMDSVRGQVLTVDRGATFRDCLMGLYDEHRSLKP
jgi:enoyl-[acyl-carrier-protein] reductase (NADH)